VLGGGGGFGGPAFGPGVRGGRGGRAAPAAAALIVYPVDLARGGPLILQSLLGANPLLGSRFYGIGNEMVSSLPVVVLAGVAAVLPRRPGPRRDLALWLAVGLALTGLVSAGVLGAKVGAVFAIGGATAAGAVMLLPGRPTLRRALVAVLAPALGLAALAALDLATGAGAHFTRTILDANSAGDVLVTFRRKLELAWDVLRHGLFPLDTIVCALALAAGIRYRVRLLAPVAGSAAWPAYFVAVAFGSVLGSLTNDSGPLLLVIGTFGLACVALYLRGDPRLARGPGPPLPTPADGDGLGRVPMTSRTAEASAELLTNS